MKKVLPRKRTLRLLTIVGAVILCLGISYAGARHIAWPWFKAWREDRANNIAREYLSKGDYANALVAVRKTLSYNQLNTEAWKLAVEITEKQESPQVIYYQQRLATVQPTLENKLKHLRLAVKYHAYKYALENVEKVGADVSKSAEFYELAANIAQHTGNNTKAKYYLISLVALQPNNNKARLDLAQIRLMDGFEENKPAIRSEIQALATDPALRVRALSMLLADAIDSQDAAVALPLAEQLVNTPNLSTTSQLLIAETYRVHAPDKSDAYIAQLERGADSREKIIALSTFLTMHGLAAETRRWLDTLPDDKRSDEPIQVAYAYALLTLKDNAALETYLRGLKWGDSEYIRQMFLAYAYRQRFDIRSFNDAWQLTLIEAGNTPAKLQFLLSQTSIWNWPEQKYEVLWKQISLNPSDKNTRSQLALWEISKGNTVNLNRLFARVAESDPSDNDARNNYNYTSIILNTNVDRANRDAYDLYKAEPSNPYYTTTYALSLYKQNKSDEALRVIETLGSAALVTPERALVRSVILIGNGRIDEGVELVSHIDLNHVLPEERRLFTETSALIAKSKRDQASVARLAALTSGTAGGSATEKKSWLATLSASLRSNVSVQMELADSLYAADDFGNLADTLRADRWPENDFLRNALLAYAQKKLQRDTAARDTWRMALMGAGASSENLNTLDTLSENWGWITERVELQNRIIQRDPQNQKAFDQLTEYYTKYGQTSELARIFALRVDGDGANLETKLRFAYYSLLTDSNMARAHVIAKEAYDSDPKNPNTVKVYAFSLLKQSRAADGWRILAELPDRTESGFAQLSFLKAILAAQQNDSKQARTQLSSFDSKSALPEEISMADAVNRSLALSSST